MLNKLEKSGVIIDNSNRFRVLKHSVSYWASEGQWETNYKTLLENGGKNLKLTGDLVEQLQMMIGRAENNVSACGFK